MKILGPKYAKGFEWRGKAAGKVARKITLRRNCEMR